MSKLGDKDFENYVEEYKFTIRTQQQMINELINKIDKAIEYIKSEKYFDDIEVVRLFDKYENVLLEILGDKE